MIKFLLIFLLVGNDGVQPVQVDKFNTLAECQKSLAEGTKQLPVDARIDYVAVCAPVKNATEQDT